MARQGGILCVNFPADSLWKVLAKFLLFRETLLRTKLQGRNQDTIHQHQLLAAQDTIHPTSTSFLLLRIPSTPPASAPCCLRHHRHQLAVAQVTIHPTTTTTLLRRATTTPAAAASYCSE
jgi:hypothetical protein